MFGTRGLAAIALTALMACTRSAPSEPTPSVPPSQGAYVWQRNWTPGVRDAVAHPPVGIDGLRVLIAEVAPVSEGPPVLETMAVDAPSLAAAHVPITLVVRIEGSRPIEGLSLARVVGVADALRAGGVDVAGIEVDHDCATARLAEYARWLAGQRTSATPPSVSAPSGSVAPSASSATRERYRFSITALPTWASSPALIDVANAVDEIVVQVHAVRAPLIFDANTAWRDLTRFARAITPARTTGVAGRVLALRVALPTYRAVVRGLDVSVDPEDVAAFVRRLSTTPIAGVGGIAWFRLPVEGDEQTWPRATFARIVAGASPGQRGAVVELVAQGDQQFDVVVSNPTGELVEMPAVHVVGDIGAADMVMGYRATGAGRWEAPPKTLARDERIVIGWIQGKDISLVD